MGKFDHITEWIFDLDNTLYPSSCDLFGQVDQLMTKYVMQVTGQGFDAARKLQKQLYRDYGTTLNGLMEIHNIEPDPYLKAVHDIDYSCVSPHPELVSLIKGLPGRKFIFTNADVPHAEAVLHRLGGADIFDGMFDIKGAGYRPKPERVAYDQCLKTFDIDPKIAVMFDDLEQNLSVPHDLGMGTVQVLSATDANQETAPSRQAHHVHHTTTDLPAFLKDISLQIA